ncbi:hypothetical protein ABKN59_007057 [Abortiporus biennis]
MNAVKSHRSRLGDECAFVKLTKGKIFLGYQTWTSYGRLRHCLVSCSSPSLEDAFIKHVILIYDLSYPIILWRLIESRGWLERWQILLETLRGQLAEVKIYFSALQT